MYTPVFNHFHYTPVLISIGLYFVICL